MMLSEGTKWRILATICFVSTAMGAYIGAQDRGRFLETVQVYHTSRWYTNVLPGEHPDSRTDASTLIFSGDAHIDVSKSVGYVDGQTWCAAPVVGDQTASFNE